MNILMKPPPSRNAAFRIKVEEWDDDTPEDYNGSFYTYSSSEWGDLLVKFGNINITYDSIGNPLSYNNRNSYTFTWSGRRMTSAVTGGKTMSFTYNDEGIRTSKTVNGVTTTYYLYGSQIVGEEINGNVTLYLYDSTGLPIGMQYHASSYAAGQVDVYWFERNLQGDIVAVYDASGTKLISYTYDAWGEIHGVTYYNGASSSHVVAKNPFRYRGYYYDADLRFYYLNSRYYDPFVCRFINADSALYHHMLGYNMLVYTSNNPVNYIDYTGENEQAILEIIASLGGIVDDTPTYVDDIALLVVAAMLGSVDVGDNIQKSNGYLYYYCFDLEYQQNLIVDTNNIPSKRINVEGAVKIVAFCITLLLDENYDPNPYARPGEKKQNRENRSKSRTKDGWEPRNNRRDGRPAKPKSHTPSKKGHKKYFVSTGPIRIFPG